MLEMQGLILAIDGNEEFRYKVDSDEGCQLRCFVFASRRALTRFSSMSFVLLMDSTYKTNGSDMPSC